MISRRKLIHWQIAAYLKDAGTAAEPDLVAQHAEQAGEAQMAITYYQMSGADAASRSGIAEAISAYNSALRVIESLPPGTDRDRHEIECRLALGAPLTAKVGYASKQVEGIYTKARALCDKVGAQDQLFDSIRGQWTSLYNQGRFLEVVPRTWWKFSGGVLRAG